MAIELQTKLFSNPHIGVTAVGDFELISQGLSIAEQMHHDALYAHALVLALREVSSGLDSGHGSAGAGCEYVKDVANNYMREWGY